MKSFLIVNHPVPSVGLGGKVEDSLLAIKKVTNTSRSRAIGGSENLEVPVLFGGDNLPPLVEIGLSDLPKSWGGAIATPAPPLLRSLVPSRRLKGFSNLFIGCIYRRHCCSNAMKKIPQNLI